jgi:hypothetical protein
MSVADVLVVILVATLAVAACGSGAISSSGADALDGHGGAFTLEISDELMGFG